MPANLDIYGDYAAGYCEEAPALSAYHFDHPAICFNLHRLPLYPEYEMLFDQATVQSAGSDTIAYEPFAQELTMRLTWPRMAAADKILLETLFKTAAKGMAEPFIYTNLITGPSQRVRFAEPVLPTMPEIAYEQYQVSIGLRVDLQYPMQVASGVPNPAIGGNRFTIGSVVMQLPVPLRPNTGYGVTRFQLLGRDSSGVPVIYEKSRIMRQPHSYRVILNYDQFIALQAFFFSFVHGQRNNFVWYDWNNIAHTMRLAAPKITVKQLGYNRYEVDLPLIEEVAL